MIVADWIIIIAKVLELIANDMSQQQAVSSAASLFNVSVDDIRRHTCF